MQLIECPTCRRRFKPGENCGLSSCSLRTHKVMTPEEYASMPIIGWHEVCRDVDGFGGVGIRFLGQSAMTRHRWSDKVVISPNKSERECQNGCGIVKVSRHEVEGGREVHWQEFWRGLDKIECTSTPPCTGRAKAVEYGARGYPL